MDHTPHKFAIADAACETVADDIQVAAYTRKKKNKKDKNIPVRIEIIPAAEEQMQCACGKCKQVIRYETKQLMHYQPPVHQIIEQRREVVACEDGCDSEIVTAPAPLHVLPKVKATESFLSFLAVSKLDDRQPLYHLEKNCENAIELTARAKRWHAG